MPMKPALQMESFPHTSCPHESFQPPNKERDLNHEGSSPFTCVLIGGEGGYTIMNHKERGLSAYHLPNPQSNNAVVTPPSNQWAALLRIFK
jgi:hypothetical protein